MVSDAVRAEDHDRAQEITDTALDELARVVTYHRAVPATGTRSPSRGRTRVVAGAVPPNGPPLAGHAAASPPCRSLPLSLCLPRRLATNHWQPETNGAAAGAI